MFCWLSEGDFIATDTAQQNLLNFCGTNGINTLFLDFYNYLGAANWTSTKVTRVKQFIAVAHASGIRVYALCGNADWGTNQSWVLRNVIRRLEDFNLIADTGSSNASSGFDGIMFDVEYWTVGGYNASIEVPALCDLMRAVRRATHLPVGLFATQWLTSSGAQTVTYNGVTQEEGYHLMDNADFTAVACYSNNNGGTDGAVQISQFQPWYDYAEDETRNYGLYCTSSTDVGLPLGLSYAGSTKSGMEQNHTTISNQFSASADSVFLGQAINAYGTYLLLP
jgi:hypothetical protein